MTPQKVDSQQLDGEAFASRGDGQDLIHWIRHQKMIVFEGQREGVQLEEPEVGVSRSHFDV